MHDFWLVLHQPGVNWFSIIAIPLMIVVPTIFTIHYSERMKDND